MAMTNYTDVTAVVSNKAAGDAVATVTKFRDDMVAKKAQLDAAATAVLDLTAPDEQVCAVTLDDTGAHRIEVHDDLVSEFHIWAQSADLEA